METGNKNRCVLEERKKKVLERLMRRKKKVLERLMRFRAFPERVGPRILSLESVDYFGISEHFSGR